MSRIYTPLPLSASMACRGTALLYFNVLFLYYKALSRSTVSNFTTFMKCYGVLPVSVLQESTAGLYSKSDESTPQPLILFETHFNILPHLRLGLLTDIHIYSNIWARPI
jgi:hypothetical protein